MPDLVASGTPLYSAGKFGDALNPNGGYFSQTTARGSDAQFTLEGWFRWTGGTTSTNRVAVAMATNASPLFLYIGMGTNGRARLAYGSLVYDWNSVQIDNGSWHHLSISFDNGTMRFFVNGALGNQSAGGGVQSSPNGWVVGRDIGLTTASQWVGQIDEVRLSGSVRYSAAFTPPTAPFTTDAATVALYRFNGDGTDAASAPTGNTATAAFTGEGSLSGSASVALTSSAAFTGEGVLSGDASGAIEATATADFTGSGSLSATAEVAVSDTATFTGSGSLSGYGTPEFFVSADFTGSGSLSGEGSAAQALTAAALFSGSGSLTAAATVALADSLTLTGVGTLSGFGVPAFSAAALFSGSGDLSGYRVRETPLNPYLYSASVGGTTRGTVTSGHRTRIETTLTKGAR